MIRNKIKLIYVMAIAVAASAPMLALATNGLNPEGTGPKNRGMGGAGVAIANETQSIINNPAAVTGVGDRQDVALGLFSPKERGYDASLFGSQTSDSNLFAIPFYGYSKQLDDGAAWAFTLSAVGGMNTDYAINFVGVPNSPTGIDLAQMFFGATYGAKISDSLAWGVTASLAYQQFAAEGLQAFQPFSDDGGNMTDRGTDTSTGIGLKVGLLGQMANGGTWGASYQFKTDMSEFDKYAGLFEGQGDLDIAPTLTLGVAIPIAADTMLALDYHYIDYEAVPSISNSTNLLDLADPLTYFGTSGGPGFGWQNISVIKAGVSIKTAPDMVWRGGINIGESPLTADEISTAFLVPATITKHLTAGFTKQLSANSELTAVWVHSLQNSQSGDFLFGGTMEASMEQNFIEVSYGTTF